MRWFGLVAALGAAVASVFTAHGLAGIVDLPKPPFDSTHLRQIENQRPDFVLIGNSMVNSRIQLRRLNREIAPRSAYLLWRGASFSGGWYLQLKNSVVASKAKPRRVIFFFRDARLTDPLNRIDGRYAPIILSESTESEETFHRVVASARQGWRGVAAAKLRRFLPLLRLHLLTLRPLEWIGLTTSKWTGGPTSAKDRMHAINSLFQFEKARAETGRRPIAGPLDPVDFDVALDRSFLPELLRLGRESGIELFFLQVGTNPHKGPAGERTAALEAYRRKLEAYLHENGAGYRDLYRAPWVPYEYWGEGDHIAEVYKHKYTSLLLKHVPELFE